ncbi:MAG: mannose-1-phosphate guanylyltransferase/mannose-6-phosphate isomerase [Methylocystaceae bacterium]|nr:mannose-1-phosphate guanylyltransferase/mannose-6-phosphate isomerase [Methylocystaceae bacterium]
MQKIRPVIMCGGAGTRMWPESRESLPKQFITLFGDHSTFQDTISMLAASPLFETPMVITNQDYAELVRSQVDAVGAKAEIVLEPMRRDSAAAVAAATEIAMSKDPQSVLAVLAADHAIKNRAGMVAICAEAAMIAAQGYIVTLGIEPEFPATGYGYIKTGSAIGDQGEVKKVAAFVEKPNLETAQSYCAQGYLWNSGNFIFRADVMREELMQFEPGIIEPVRQAVVNARAELGLLHLDTKAFETAVKKSIDFAVMERTARAAVIPANIGWSDIGTWSAVRDLTQRDDKGNAVRGDGVILNAHNAYIRSTGLLTTIVGVDNVIVVATADAVLVLNASQADKVKDLVDQLKQNARSEIARHR